MNLAQIKQMWEKKKVKVQLNRLYGLTPLFLRRARLTQPVAEVKSGKPLNLRAARTAFHGGTMIFLTSVDGAVPRS